MAQSQDPIDRLFGNKDNLKRLGIVSSTKTSAAELEYQAKFDTLVKIARGKARRSDERAKKVIEIFAPLAEECMKAIAKKRRERNAMIHNKKRDDSQDSEKC